MAQEYLIDPEVAAEATFWIVVPTAIYLFIRYRQKKKAKAE